MKNHYFRKEFLDDTFFYSVRTFAQHYFSKYWGGRERMHGPSPHQILGGPSPSLLLGLRPWLSVYLSLSRSVCVCVCGQQGLAVRLSLGIAAIYSQAL